MQPPAAATQASSTKRQSAVRRALTTCRRIGKKREASLAIPTSTTMPITERHDRFAGAGLVLFVVGATGGLALISKRHLLHGNAAESQC